MTDAIRWRSLLPGLHRAISEMLLDLRECPEYQRLLIIHDFLDCAEAHFESGRAASSALRSESGNRQSAFENMNLRAPPLAAQPVLRLLADFLPPYS